MRTLLAWLMVFGILSATTLEIKKGWQLIGVSTTMDAQTYFNNKSVEIVWGFNAASQSWMGYSPDAQKESVIIDKYSPLNSIKPWQAVWIFSREEWTLTYSPQSSVTTPLNSAVELKNGWNLISIPQQIVVSENFFGDALVWKYTQNSQWQVNKTNLNFPSIETISMSEGLWVKSDGDKTIDVDQQSSKLSSFDSKESMLAYIRKMIRMNNYYGYPYPLSTVVDVAVVSAPEAVGDTSTIKNATTTNTQEAGVDEGDIVKNDGVYVFSVDNANQRIIVTSFLNLAKQDYAPIATLPFKDQYVQSMYLQNNRLLVVSTHNNSLTLDVYDVSDIQNVRSIATHATEGSYRDSRLVNGKLFLISDFSPYLSYEYEKKYVTTTCSQSVQEAVAYFTDPSISVYNKCYFYGYDEKGAYVYNYENPIIIDEILTPYITSNGVKSDFINHAKLYAPTKLNQYANITTLSGFNAIDGNYTGNVSFLGNTSTYYASTSSLYLVSSEYPLYYDYSHYKEQQMIYKFSLDENLTYKGRGLVEGRMLSQFSMSEQDEHLRVATTSGWSWWADASTSNSIYTLKTSNEELVVDGTLLGLGKSGETIRAVRFMGNRGFVVTFKQTDPLYAIDLSDPKNPKKVGELSIPGFSEYLHVVDENRLLSVGRNADANGRAQELQFQLFDTSDFSNPLLVDTLRIGDKYSYSEAEYNHKAFTYRASDLTFGVPYRSYDAQYYENQEHFAIYKINGMKIDFLDRVDSNNSNWGDVGRGIIFDFNATSYATLLKGSNVISKKIGVTP